MLFFNSKRTTVGTKLGMFAPALPSTRTMDRTPPRRPGKRLDLRNSAERGIHKIREEDYRTPARVKGQSVISEGNNAPVHDRRLRKPLFLEEEDDRSFSPALELDPVADLLSSRLRSIVSFD